MVPKGEVKSGFKPFKLDLSTINYPAPDDELWIRHLRTEQVDVVGLGRGSVDEQRLEDYVVSGLIDFDDVAYDEHADLLYDLAEQVVTHLRGYLSPDDARKVLRLHQREIARFVHAQMQKHFWQDTDVDYEVVVTRGFTALRPSAYTAAAEEKPIHFRTSPADKSNMSKYLFGNFNKCLYSVQKFQSDAERKLAVILEREALKWFKPAKGQFQIYYKWGADNPRVSAGFRGRNWGSNFHAGTKGRQPDDGWRGSGEARRRSPVVSASQQPCSQPQWEALDLRADPSRCHR